MTHKSTDNIKLGIVNGCQWSKGQIDGIKTVESCGIFGGTAEYMKETVPYNLTQASARVLIMQNHEIFLWLIHNG